MNSTDSSVALTFDDGPGPSTERLLDVLAGYGASATFFVLGRNLDGEALNGDREHAMRIAARAVRDGHVLGNHTVTHAFRLGENALLEEVAACDDRIAQCYSLAGRPVPEYVPIRLPFGPWRKDLPGSYDALKRLGRPHCHWSGDFEDWRPERTANEIADELISHVDRMWSVGKTPVVLLHDAGQGKGDGGEAYGVLREATVDAVALLCGRLAGKGVRYRSAHEVDAESLPFSKTPSAP